MVPANPAAKQSLAGDYYQPEFSVKVQKAFSGDKAVMSWAHQLLLVGLTENAEFPVIIDEIPCHEQNALAEAEAKISLLAEKQQEFLRLAELSVSDSKAFIKQLSILLEMKQEFAGSVTLIADMISVLEAASAALRNKTVTYDFKKAKLLSNLDLRLKDLRKAKQALVKFSIFCQQQEQQIMQNYASDSLANYKAFINLLKQDENPELLKPYHEKFANILLDYIKIKTKQLNETQAKIVAQYQQLGRWSNLENTEEVFQLVCLINYELDLKNLSLATKNLQKEFDTLFWIEFDLAALADLSQEVWAIKDLLENKISWCKESFNELNSGIIQTEELIKNKLNEKPQLHALLKHELNANQHYEALLWYDKNFDHSSFKARFEQCQAILEKRANCQESEELYLQIARAAQNFLQTNKQGLAEFEQAQNNLENAFRRSSLGNKEPMPYLYFKKLEKLYHWEQALQQQRPALKEKLDRVINALSVDMACIGLIIANPYERQMVLDSLQYSRSLAKYKAAQQQIESNYKDLQDTIVEQLEYFNKSSLKEELLAYFTQAEVLEPAFKRWCEQKFNEFSQPKMAI